MVEPNKGDSKVESQETGLSGHKRHKKELIPPFSQLPKLSLSSWIHDRLPEMLWAVLVIGNMERAKALDFFRYVTKYVADHQEFADITLTGISKVDKDKQEEFIKHILNYSKEISKILRPLSVYPNIPSSDIWNKFLEKPVLDEDWKKISEGVKKTYNHQSQEATDCRWIKLLCLMIGGKMKFPKQMEEIVKEIFNYPNMGDMRKVRPTIRAAEIGLNNGDIEWHIHFWKYNYDFTECVPEEAFSQKIKSRQKKLSKDIEESRKHFLNESKKVRHELITKFFDSCETTKVDTRRETSGVNPF